jgi:enoyl-CoA hydratase/carnithine racemase
MELIDATPRPDTAVVPLPESLSVGSVSSLIEATQAAFDSPAPVVLFTGADADTFCLGLALSQADGRGVETKAFAGLLSSLLDAPKPTLAFVDGRAIGGGLGLAAACDWVVASTRATFALPELLWGLIPAMIWPIVTRRVGDGTARRWTLAAHAQPATAARTAGLVDDLTIDGQDGAAIRKAVRMLRRADPTALRELRHWTSACREQPLTTALESGAALTTRMAASPGARARIAAFTDGDAPWT